MDEYKTKDIFEASWLYSQDMPLLRLDPDSRYFWFVFSNLSKCKLMSNAYWTNAAEGKIKRFVDSLKTLKDLVFSRKT
ncbi:MAG TPA: hypothetical protein VMW29_02790 [Candidatus Bathyarchaeia archaeon]|nr:hypothetical protein [Candidatus Bathyarchaeia archaeon]